MTSGDLPQYLRARQIADIVGSSERTVRRWIADGTLPSRKIGGARLVARGDLERRLEPDQQAPWGDEDDNS